MLLRLMNENDLEQVLEWRNSPAVRKNMYTNHEISWDEHRTWFAKNAQDQNKRQLIFSIEGNNFGVVNFTEINRDFRSAFWGFYASPESPPGTGTAMEFCALSYAFGELELHKLNCEVIEFNKSVINLHTKYGFQREGLFRDHYFDGSEYHDVVRLGMMEQEWESNKEKLTKRLEKLNFLTSN